MADLLAAGKTVVDSFIATLPEELRGSATEMFGKPEAQAAIKSIGEQALMKADYSRAMNETAQERARAETAAVAAAEHKARLDAWYAQNQTRLSLGAKAEAAGWSPDAEPLQTVKPAELPTDLVRTAELESQAQLAVKYMNAAVGLGLRHLKEFGEPLDLDALITDPRVSKLGIQGVYDATYGPRYDEKRKTERDQERAKFEAEIRADERKRSANRPLTPVGDNDSPLAALQSPDKKPGSSSPSELADYYMELVAKKAG